MARSTFDTAMNKQLYIETVGCQMNVLDSEMVVASLRQHGYTLVSRPSEADTILFNTCSVRQHAEDKVYSALGRLKQLKRERPDCVIGVIGCMAQKDQRKIFERAPYVDLVVGPGQLHRIPELVETLKKGGEHQIAVSLDRTAGSVTDIKRSHETFDPLRDPSMRSTPFQAYLRIQIGCDKFCTYCVVPMTRGPEQGRAPSEILAEARILADQGCREITLLGQTVNSYLHVAGERTTRLSDLLTSLHDIDGICRLKFVTNYPLDMTNDLLDAVRTLPKCSPYLHVPLQSGADSVLKRMKRGYATGDYNRMMSNISDRLPGASVVSDFIVGFCGETDDEHQKTVDAMSHYRFKSSFVFKYSERPGTLAANRVPDDVPYSVKQQRNQELLTIQNRISEEDNQKFIGDVVDVLVEGPSKAAKHQAADAQILQLTGRTACDRIVVFEGNRRQIGEILSVVVYDANAYTLFGEVETQEVQHDLLGLSV